MLRSKITAAFAAPTVLAMGVLALDAGASSHREAPFITEMPKVDGTDFYVFRSYESGRENFVTIVANYLPLQDPYGGPNYFSMDPNARYEINIDNNGDGEPDMVFLFSFTNTLRDIKVPVGDEMVSVPLINVGGIGPTADDTANLNVIETFNAAVKLGTSILPVINLETGDNTFVKPVDNIGQKSIAEYATYAHDHVYDILVPGFPQPGRLFVGQRKDPFVVNLGETFDLVNLNPLGPPDGETDDLADKNITSFILELPIAGLTQGAEPVIGAWTTARLSRARAILSNPTFESPTSTRGPMVQVSRLGMPLVNEVVIGLRDKNRFNASAPIDDGQFLTYVTNPTLPVLLNVLFGVTPPCLPRNDLVAIFLTGIEGLNKPAGVVPAEMLRLNTSIPPVRKGSQNRLGVLGGDLAGFPNGRRPGDDVVDIALRAVMGAVLEESCAPDGQLPYTDGAIVDDSFFSDSFPYLLDPIPGSPSDASP